MVRQPLKVPEEVVEVEELVQLADLRLYACMQGEGGGELRLTRRARLDQGERWRSW